MTKQPDITVKIEFSHDLIDGMDEMNRDLLYELINQEVKIFSQSLQRKALHWQFLAKNNEIYKALEE